MDFVNTLIKEPNQRIIFNLIRVHKQLSGAELARLTGLQPSTVVYILRILADKGLIFSSGVGASTQRGGKKPTLWEISTAKYYIMGMEILPSHIRVILSSINNEILFRNEINVSKGISQGNIIEIIAATYHEIVLNQEVDKDKIIGLGIALPGLIDLESGKIHYSATLNLEDFLLVKSLEEKVNVPVFLGNDANAGALGLKWYPEDGEEEYDNQIFIMYNQEGRNLGCGVIIKNRLYQGTSGSAGEIFTSLPSIRKLIKDARESGEKGDILLSDGDHELSEIADFEKKGCLASRKVIIEVCDHISRELIKIIGLLNPEIIVLGGDLPDTDRFINKYIIPVVESEMSSKLHMGYLLPEIKNSIYKQYTVAMGANALVLSAWLNPEI